jgi:hypothetical protein
MRPPTSRGAVVQKQSFCQVFACLFVCEFVSFVSPQTLPLLDLASCAFLALYFGWSRSWTIVCGD